MDIALAPHDFGHVLGPRRMVLCSHKCTCAGTRQRLAVARRRSMGRNPSGLQPSNTRLLAIALPRGPSIHRLKALGAFSRCTPLEVRRMQMPRPSHGLTSSSPTQAPTADLLLLLAPMTLTLSGDPHLGQTYSHHCTSCTRSHPHPCTCRTLPAARRRRAAMCPRRQRGRSPAPAPA